MRYYRIVITDPDTGTVVVPPGFDGLLGGASYTSYVNGRTLPGAWNVELDIPAIDAATSQGFALARVWGISDQEISQANDLTGKAISIFGGMQKGLPLANPAQSGLLTAGTIFQSFGNNVGTDRTLDLVITPGPPMSSGNAGGLGTLRKPKNIVLNWKAGTTLAAALATTLSTAFPGYQQEISISPNLVRQNDEDGFYPTLELLAQYLRQTSFDIVKTASYAGVSVVLSGSTISVFDGTAGSSSSAPTAIAFQDLVGQPTWIEAPNISIKTVMRADLAVGKGITMPPTRIINTAQATSSLLNQRSNFLGGFSVVSMRHVGVFRAPQADAWVTVLEAAPNQVS